MEFTLTAKINATAEQVYKTWLNSEGHTNMTGGDATISDTIGGSFTSWNGYIQGKNLELVPYNKIVQSWRTSQFEEQEGDSQIEILLHEVEGQTEITLIHTKLPESGAHYIKGWENHYFQPMKDYFSE